MLSLRVVLFLILFLLPFKTASQIGVALGVDRTFQSHLNDFVKKSEGRIGHRSLKYLTLQFRELEFSKTNEGTIGLCHWSLGISSLPPTIDIDIAYWKQATKLQQWSLIYHEAGHCLCYRQHVEDYDTFITKVLDYLGVYYSRRNRLFDGCPISIMSPTDLPDWCLREHKEHYVQEMFKHCMPLLEFWRNKNS